MEKVPDCRVCNGRKVKVLRRYNGVDAWAERTVMIYEGEQEGEIVVRVYCSNAELSSTKVAFNE